MDSGTGIAFLGGGNMARALAGGLLAAGHSPAALRVFDTDAGKAAALGDDLGLTVVADATELLAADALVLAVKPQHLKNALAPLRSGLALPSAPLVISIAAGVTLNALRDWCGETPRLVRCMPNTPALVGAGASVLYADPAVPESQRQLAARVLAAVGSVHWVSRESELDAVTAISGSGPAYFFLFQELLQHSAEQLGLEADLAARLAQETALGAARLAAESDLPVSQLRSNVTSPGGTTERALGVFHDAGLAGIMERAVTAARDRSVELAEELGSAT